MRTVNYRGETFGEGTDIPIRALRGLEDLQVGPLSVDLPNHDGGIPVDAYADPRIIELEILVKPSTRQRALTAFARTQIPSPLTVDWTDETGTPLDQVAVDCRVSRRGGASRDRSTEWNSAVMRIRFEAHDPVVYGASVLSTQVGVFAASAGLSYSVVYPKQYGAGGSGAGTIVTNDGAWDSWPTLTVAGPTTGTLTDPILENVATGQSLALTANGGVLVASGQQLIIGTHPNDRSVMFASGASRYGFLSVGSEFWPLIPGANEIRFRASGDTAGATLTIAWRNALHL